MRYPLGKKCSPRGSPRLMTHSGIPTTMGYQVGSEADDPWANHASQPDVRTSVNHLVITGDAEQKNYLYGG
jgi:hypothetical protein